MQKTNPSLWANELFSDEDAIAQQIREARLARNECPYGCNEQLMIWCVDAGVMRECPRCGAFTYLPHHEFTVQVGQA